MLISLQIRHYQKKMYTTCLILALVEQKHQILKEFFWTLISIMVSITLTSIKYYDKILTGFKCIPLKKTKQIWFTLLLCK